MESEGSQNEEDVSMKLLPNEKEVPNYKSGGNEDVSISQRPEIENASNFEFWERLEKQFEVLCYFHNC